MIILTVLVLIIIFIMLGSIQITTKRVLLVGTLVGLVYFATDIQRFLA
jgi:hypothetical protein